MASSEDLQIPRGVNPYFSQRKFLQRYFHIFLQSIFKEFHRPFAGDFWIAMFDLVADSVGRLIFQFTDIQRTVPGKLQNHGFRSNHPVSRFFPQLLQKSNSIGRNMRPGNIGKPAVMPKLIVVIPAEEKLQRRIQLISMYLCRWNRRRI